MTDKTPEELLAEIRADVDKVLPKVSELVSLGFEVGIVLLWAEPRYARRDLKFNIQAKKEIKG